MALTTVTDPVEILKFHFGESIFGFTSGLIHFGRLADVGTGAGFPGIPLHLVCPSIKPTLIESNLKKSTFLAEVVRKLGIEDSVSIWRGRFEEFSVDQGSRFDYITTRALGNVDDLLVFYRDALRETGRVILWVGENDARRLHASQSGLWKWSPPLKISGSKQRYIIAGQML